MNGCRVILLVENMSFPRDRRVRLEASALKSAGLEVSVICPSGTKQDSSSFEMLDGIRIYRYRQRWKGKDSVGYCLEYSWAMLCSFWLVLRIWLRYGFDILHAANPPDLFFLLAAPFKLLGKKFVYDQHDLSPEMFEAKFGVRGLPYSLLVLLERLSYRFANAIIVTNESFRQIALERGGVRSEKVFIVRNGPEWIKTQSVAPRVELKKGATFLALYVGVMNKQDGVERVIQAAHHIVNIRGRKDIRFALLGTGDSLDELRLLAKSLAVESYVDFPGWMCDSDLLAYLCTADVCLAPDPPIRLNQLSTMIKIMEYMSCAKPVVSFDLLETRRSAGAAAVYVQRDDPGVFGDAIVDLIDNPSVRAELGNAGLHRVRTTLNWGCSRVRLLDVYKKLAE